MKHLTLTEYETAIVRLSDESARTIARLIAGKLIIVPASEPDCYSMTATQYVGTVVLPDLEILIRPKIPIENLFLLLDVGVPMDAWRQEVFAYQTERNLLAALAAFFARTLEQTLARGLIRSYTVQREQLIAVRGRVDIVRQIRKPGPVTPIACVFDEYSADIDENRYLKAAVQRLLRVGGLPSESRRSLERVLNLFQEVRDAPVDPEHPSRMRFTRLNRHYQPALRLGRLILLNLGFIDLRGGPKGTEASAFLMDMNELFQRFLTSRLSRYLRGNLQMLTEPLRKLGTKGEIEMHPDLVFRKEERDVYVADAKYKITFTGFGSATDYYQLLAYTIALDLPEGVLIYCQSTGSVPPREIGVHHAAKRLRTYAIDLSGPASQVETAVSNLGSWILNRTSLRGS